MDKYSIIKDDLCIKKILAVIKGNNTNHHKKILLHGRHSDALVYVSEGSCSYTFDDGVSFVAKRGDVFYLPYQSVYTMYISTEDYRFIFCDFVFEEAPTSAAIFHAEHSIDTEGLFVKLLNAYRSGSINKHTECMSILYNIYNLLQRSGSEQSPDKSHTALIDCAVRSLEEGFGDSTLQLSDIARTLGISEVYFRRLFKNKYGTSPIKYLNSLRLKNSIKLMKYSFLSLEECSKQSGFSSLQYYCRLFKKEFGISPGKFRETL